MRFAVGVLLHGSFAASWGSVPCMKVRTSMLVVTVSSSAIASLPLQERTSATPTPSVVGTTQKMTRPDSRQGAAEGLMRQGRKATVFRNPGAIRYNMFQVFHNQV